MLLNTSSTKMLINLVKTLQSRKKIVLSCGSRIQEFSSQDTSHEKKSLDFGASYTAEQQVSILQKINTCTIDELKRYSITEARIKKLTAHRDRYGAFVSINEVLLMQGIDISILDRFCKSIIKGESVAKNKPASVKNDLLTPALDNDVRTAIRTSTGIWVYGSVISWSQLDTDCNLLSWECVCLEDVALKDGIIGTVEAVASVVSRVPVSHAYVMESDPIIPFSRINSVAYYLQLQRQQIVSTIVSLLGTRERCFGEGGESGTLINNIYMMRPRTSARLFDLLIGSETVSGKSAVEKILNNDEDDDAIIHIHADKAVTESYRLQDIYQREQMNLALLLTSAFLNLSILRVSTLKKGGKKKPGKSMI